MLAHTHTHTEVWRSLQWRVEGAGCKARRDSRSGERGIGRDGGALAPELAVLFKIYPQGLQTGRNIDGDAKRSREANEERREATQKRWSPWRPRLISLLSPHQGLEPAFPTHLLLSTPARHPPATLSLGSVPITCRALSLPQNICSSLFLQILQWLAPLCNHSMLSPLTSVSNHTSLCLISLCHCLQSIHPLQ